MPSHRFSRRLMLRGLGVSMALPWLESLRVWGDEPAAKQSSSEAPLRVAVLFAGNGFHSKEWWAKGAGREMELGQVLAPLADVREKIRAAMAETLADPDVKQKLEDLGMELFDEGPEEFAKFLAAEVATMKEVVKSAGIQPQ